MLSAGRSRLIQKLSMTFQIFLESLKHDGPHNWPEQAALWAEALSDQQVLHEVHSIMDNHNYSWHCINGLLQDRLEQGDLKFTFEDRDVLFGWNNLCDGKRR